MTTEPQALTPTTMDSLREELGRVRAQLAEYVGFEPTIAEEMKHLSDENMQLRKIAAYLLLEYGEKSTVDLWDEDIDGYTGRLDIEPSPNRRETTRVTYTRPSFAPRAPRPKTPTAPADDPWAPNPLLKKLDTFRQIVTEHVVRALLYTDGTSGSEWARRLTWALEQEGIDLTDGIRARINELTLGRNPSEPPF